MINDHTQWLYHAEHGGRLFQKGELITKGWYDSPDFDNAVAMWGDAESDDAPIFDESMLAEDGQAEPAVEEDDIIGEPEIVEPEDDEEIFTCPICGKTYKSEAWLEKHIQKAHNGDE